MSGTIDRKKQEYRTRPVLGFIGRIQPFISVFGRAPDFIFDTPMYIIFTEALNDKKPSILRTHIEALRVVFIDTTEVIQHRMRHRRSLAGTSVSACLTQTSVSASSGFTSACHRSAVHLRLSVTGTRSLSTTRHHHRTASTTMMSTARGLWWHRRWGSSESRRSNTSVSATIVMAMMVVHNWRHIRGRNLVWRSWWWWGLLHH